MKQTINRNIVMGLGFLILMLVSCTTAPTTPPPTAEPAVAPKTSEIPEWFFHDIADAEFVKQHLTIPMEENVMLIDARPYKPKYISGHIPMAVSIPDTQFEKMTDQLPKDKNALLIFYCEGPECKLSHKSAKKAEALGYSNVKVYADGFPGWIKIAGNYPSVSAKWLKKQMDDKTDMLLIDSRPQKAKYDKGHIPGAVSIPDTNFDKMTGQLPADKEKLLVFYCGGLDCRLSHKSAQKAIALGYKNVKVFSAGYPAWQVLAGAGTEGKVKTETAEIKSGKEEGSIDPEYFKKIIAENPESIYVVDVRDADEFKKGSLKTAVNIPVDTLEKQIKSLPSDKPVVFICGTGARSGESYYMVQDMRPELKKVYYIEGAMKFKKDGTYTITKPAK